MRHAVRGQMEQQCIVCDGPIHPERLLALPWVKSCSHECSVGRKVELNRLASQRRRDRRRADTEGVKKESIIPKPGYAIPRDR